MLSGNVDNALGDRDQFLICGLGSLGQHCVMALKKFGVMAIAIEQTRPPYWEYADLEKKLDRLIIGDCRQDSILESANIRQCRAAILVTTSEQVNIETALAIRQLNPDARLVIRSAKENLNRLLEEQLGNLIAYESTELPASAFALAALGTEVLGYFFLDGQRLRVLQKTMTPDHPWCQTRYLYELNTRSQRILGYISSETNAESHFYDWHPETLVQPNDIITYLELADERDAIAAMVALPAETSTRLKLFIQFKQFFHKQRSKFLQLDFKQQVRRIALISGLIVVLLLILGTILIHSSEANTTWLSSFSATAILLLGGYSDLFGEFGKSDDIPAWLQLFSLGLTLVGTVFVGILYALLTDALLSSQFQFKTNITPIPKRNHVVLVGLGRVGSKVATLLKSFKQSLVGITGQSELKGSILDTIPIIRGFTKDSLIDAHIDRAKSIIIATDDEILNLEVALTVQRLNPSLPLVIRTASDRLTQHLSHLLPTAQIWDVYAVAAEVFAGAAFGENITYLFRCNQQTILVTEYQIETGDTLNGLLLTDIAYGYGVVPILHQKPPTASQLLPVDDVRLAVGDRLVVLATIDGLKRIEQSRRTHLKKDWRVRIEVASTGEAKFEGANLMALIAGCSLGQARDIMHQLPAVLDCDLYQPQALRLVRALKRNRVKASAIAPKS